MTQDRIVIDGKGISDYTKQLDNGLKQQERIKLVDSILCEGLNDFLTEAFDNYVETNISQADYQISNNEICKGLEKFANYILYAPDGERITKKTKYNFYTSKTLNKKINKDNGNRLDEIDFYLESKNYKKDNSQVITEKDFEDRAFNSEVEISKDYNRCVFIVNILKEYQKEIDLYNKLIKQSSNNNKKRHYKKIKDSIKETQVYIKDKFKGTIYFKNPLKDSKCLDYYDFSFLNSEHIKSLLKLRYKSSKPEVSCIIADLEKIIKYIKLSVRDRIILDMYSNEDTTIGDIAKRLKVKDKYILEDLYRIIRRIIRKYYDIYEDWYYLEVEKGTYKTCSKCGEVKLISKFYKHPETKDNHENLCINCKN